MITIEVTLANGEPLAQPMVAEFDELGGNIGRADGNTLVLSDPQKIISRTHAVVAFRDGRYILRDQGSVTPVYINGRALGNGHEAPIEPGDELRIGGYTLAVKPAPRSARPAPERAGQDSQRGPRAGTKDDPLQMFGSGARGAERAGLFDDLIAPAPEPRPLGPAPGRAKAPQDPIAGKAAADGVGSGMAIPLDFDIFEPSASPATPKPADRRAPLDDLGLAGGTGDNIDKLFDLGASGRSDLFAPGRPLGEPISQPNTAAGDDPLASLSAAPRGERGRSPQRDDAPEIRGAFQLPQPRPDAGPSSGQPAPDIIVSWDKADEEQGEIQTVVVPSPGGGPKHGVAEGDSARMRPPESTPPSASSASPANAAPQGEGAASADELLRAFLGGAGVPDLGMPELTLRLMEILGQLLREAAQGTLDLLAARAIAKREMRAEMTMIIPRENNPLKFSPNVEAALSHLLAPQGRGFMSPLRAMRDAYDDLRAHQFASMAGMRDALSGVLARFDPAHLERRLTQKSVIDSVLPMNRKAKLWDLFEQLYADIEREAEDDFHTLFGREFVRAYEAQLAKLAQGRKDRKE